jgi:predicted regulator of Ras-like GTPase activity (Roadblock/LC7/MglB family)
LSYSKDDQLLRKILRAIINSTAGLKYAIIIDDTGITIMSLAKFVSSDNDISVEKIGAIAGAVFTAGEEQGQILGYGGISIQITEYGSGLIFSAKAGKGVLCIATDLNVQIGFIRAILKKWAPKISQILGRYLESDQGEINKELKELFNSDTLGFM